VPSSYNRHILKLITQKDCMSSIKCRSYARGDNVVMKSVDVLFVIDIIKGIIIYLSPNL
jgi:hypothetical protein